MVVPLEVLYLIFDKKSSTPEKSGKKVKIPRFRAGFFREEAHKRCVISQCYLLDQLEFT